MGGRFEALCRLIEMVIGVIRNFLSWEGVLGLCVGGLGGDTGDTEFSVMGGCFGALCRWIGMVIGVIRNSLSWEDAQGLCEVQCLTGAKYRH